MDKLWNQLRGLPDNVWGFLNPNTKRYDITSKKTQGNDIPFYKDGKGNIIIHPPFWDRYLHERMVENDEGNKDYLSVNDLSNAFNDVDYFSVLGEYDFVEIRSRFIFKGSDFFFYQDDKLIPNYPTWFSSYDISKHYGPVVAYQLKRKLRLLNMSSPLTIQYITDKMVKGFTFYEFEEMKKEKLFGTEDKGITTLGKLMEKSINHLDAPKGIDLKQTINDVNQYDKYIKALINTTFLIEKEGNAFHVRRLSNYDTDLVLIRLLCKDLASLGFDGWYHPLMTGLRFGKRKFQLAPEIMLCNPKEILFNYIQLI